SPTRRSSDLDGKKHREIEIKIRDGKRKGERSNKKERGMGGTVAQAVAPTIYGLECPRGHGFESDPLLFPDHTPQQLSPSHFLSKPSLSYLIKSKKPKNKSLKKKK